MTGFTDEQVYDIAARLGYPFETVRDILCAVSEMMAKRISDDDIAAVHGRFIPSYMPVATKDVRQIIELYEALR